VNFCCRPGRASQEFLGFFLALALLAVELLDYANWSRECYHRRLTMTVHSEVDPPLYPIPGATINNDKFWAYTGPSAMPCGWPAVSWPCGVVIVKAVDGQCRVKNRAG
jgi:hypothetical protein